MLSESRNATFLDSVTPIASGLATFSLATPYSDLSCTFSKILALTVIPSVFSPVPNLNLHNSLSLFLSLPLADRICAWFVHTTLTPIATPSKTRPFYINTHIHIRTGIFIVSRVLRSRAFSFFFFSLSPFLLQRKANDCKDHHGVIVRAVVPLYDFPLLFLDLIGNSTFAWRPLPVYLLAGNGGFSGQVPLRLPFHFNRLVVALHICFKVGCLVFEPQIGSICEISSWWLEVF